MIMLSSGMIASTWQLPRASTGNEAEKERRTYLLHPLLAFLLYIYIYIHMSSIPRQYRALLKAGYAAVNHAAYQKRHVRARIRRRFIDPPDNNVKANLDLKSK